MDAPLKGSLRKREALSVQFSHNGAGPFGLVNVAFLKINKQHFHALGRERTGRRSPRLVFMPTWRFVRRTCMNALLSCVTHPGR
jgi:hypothetical protein